METDNEFQVGIKLRTYNHNLDAALKRAQKEAGLTRVNYCNQVLGINYTTIASYLSFKNYPREERLLQIAICLNVIPDSIFPDQIEDIRLSRQPDAATIPLAEAVALGFGGFTDPSAIGSDTHLDQVFLPAAIQAVLETLTARESYILKERFGLGDGVPRSIKDIGDEVGVTKGRIQQIEQKALRKLRHPSRAKGLKVNDDTDQCAFILQLLPATPIRADLLPGEPSQWNWARCEVTVNLMALDYPVDNPNRRVLTHVIAQDLFCPPHWKIAQNPSKYNFRIHRDHGRFIEPLGMVQAEGRD